MVRRTKRRCQRYFVSLRTYVCDETIWGETDCGGGGRRGGRLLRRNAGAGGGRGSSDRAESVRRCGQSRRAASRYGAVSAAGSGTGGDGGKRLRGRGPGPVLR